MSPDPNTIAPLHSDLAAVLRELDSGSRERGAVALRQLAHANPNRTEWPYLPWSAKSDTPENHAVYLEKHGGAEYIAAAYATYAWTVAA